MYRRIDDFLADWKYESQATGNVLNHLTNASLTQEVIPGGRTLGRLAWHLVLTLGEMGGKAGLGVQAPHEDAAQPTEPAEIRRLYDRAAASLADQILARWSDAALADRIDMYGESWARGTVLSSLILHQAHHRGQMTVLMRQAGLRVPGVYGPAREEWAAMGLPAQP